MYAASHPHRVRKDGGISTHKNDTCFACSEHNPQLIGTRGCLPWINPPTGRTVAERGAKPSRRKKKNIHTTAFVPAPLLLYFSAIDIFECTSGCSEKKSARRALPPACLARRATRVRCTHGWHFVERERVVAYAHTRHGTYYTGRVHGLSLHCQLRTWQSCHNRLGLRACHSFSAGLLWPFWTQAHAVG